MSEPTFERTNFTKAIENQCKTLKGKRLLALIAPPEEEANTSAEMLKVLINEYDYGGIYLTMNKPYAEIDKRLAERGIDTSRLYFIDGISCMHGLKAEDSDRCRYVPEPSDTSSMVAAVEDLLQKVEPKKRFIFLDSITSLLVYDALQGAREFIKSLEEKLEGSNAHLVMLSLAKGTNSMKLLEEMTQKCGEIFDLTAVAE